ncbi:MAG: hypothetical protein B7Y36_11140 [Novosphingobium sp. 28-62-57]|uniref:hypothetical protein n=1 Tax=Novosphingobium sp. 28-62-57 TaxID=1970409 RepID=UPI000BD435D7|nr:hypothetical protein [Novosphingobium sp. 28-62-57]OYW50924.1 MAG: hypothetical protein B7Z34_03695 [Novosphingobium sp. 12-62-10]OYZ09938.1 MAG: hypothetical protein B7Y36_11140 [Novosphingobium sp. 28-62-57]HQS71100.1 hypothetical protein [Novosphingobium sp.]
MAMLDSDAYARTAILDTIWTEGAHPEGWKDVPAGEDFDLLTHGVRWVSVILAIHTATMAQGLPPRLFEESKEPFRQAVWQAERAIDALPARTARGAALKLRVALYTMLPEGMIEPFLRNDLETITAGDVDYPARAVAKILQDLDAMASATPSPDANQGEAKQ